jgi:hypothetical protein
MYIPNLAKVIKKYTYIVDGNCYNHEIKTNALHGIIPILVRYTKILDNTTSYIRPRLGVYKLCGNKPFVITIPPLMKKHKSINYNGKHIVEFTCEQLNEQNNNSFKGTAQGLIKYADFIAQSSMSTCCDDLKFNCSYEELIKFYNSCMCWNAYDNDHTSGHSQPQLVDWKWDIETDYSTEFQITWLSPNILLNIDEYTHTLRYST